MKDADSVGINKVKEKRKDDIQDTPDDQDELEIEEEVDISGEAGKYKPTEVHRSDIPISTPVNDGSSSDDELVSYNGGMSIDELCDTLDREHEAPNTTSLRDILSTEYSPA